MLVRDEALTLPPDQTAEICDGSELNTLETRGRLSIAGCSPKEVSFSASEKGGILPTFGSCCFGLRQFNFRGPISAAPRCMCVTSRVGYGCAVCAEMPMAFTPVVSPPPPGGQSWPRLGMSVVMDQLTTKVRSYFSGTGPGHFRVVVIKGARRIQRVPQFGRFLRLTWAALGPVALVIYLCKLYQA